MLFYGSVILKEQVGGQSDSAAIGANVLVGLVNFAATIVALVIIDRLGRRRLLMGSAAGLGVGLLALAAAFLSQPPSAGSGRGLHAFLRRELLGGTGASGLGDALGDLPEPDPRPRHGPGDGRSVGRVHGADHDVPVDHQGPWPLRARSPFTRPSTPCSCGSSGGTLPRRRAGRLEEIEQFWKGRES